MKISATPDCSRGLWKWRRQRLKRFNKIADSFTDLFFPKRCAICDKVLGASERGCCKKCLLDTEPIRGAKCCRCGKPVEEEQEYCGDCRGKKTAFLQGRCLYPYSRRLQESIARFKYLGRREYAGFYAEMMCQVYGEWMRRISASALVPVPIHINRYRQRGYNQAELIAAGIGENMGIPVYNGLIARCRDTLPQKDLSYTERKNNLKGAFISIKNEGIPSQELNRDLECVIIIDDIYTTGSTIEECSEVLKEIGVKKIYFLCVCIGSGDQGL